MTTTPGIGIPLEHLQALGFSEYEAKSYTALLLRGPLSGYQLAKASGIPRPNIYPILDRLQHRGVVVKIAVKGGHKYGAVPSEEMLTGLSREVRVHLEKAQESLRQLVAATPIAADYVLNIQGYSAVIANAERIVESAEHQLLVGIWADESRHLSQAFSRAQGRGIHPTILCIQGCAEECGACRGRVYRYPLAFSAHTRWLVLAADGKELLVGQVFPNGDATAVSARQEVFVSIASQYLRNAIATAEIVRSVGPRLRDLVDAQALEALEGVDLSVAGASWLNDFLSATQPTKQ